MLPPHSDIPELTVYGTGFKEHGCEDGWCNLRKDWPKNEKVLDERTKASSASALFTTHVSNMSDGTSEPEHWSLAAAIAKAGVGSTLGCYDEDNRCPMWAKAGECGANPAYMLNSCRNSCHVCEGRPKYKDEL